MVFKNPFDFCMESMTWEAVFSHDKSIQVFQDEAMAHITFETKGKKPKTVSIPINEKYITVPAEAKTNLSKEEKISKFKIFTDLQFKGNYRWCLSFIEYQFQHKKFPYIRVGTDYFKVIHKKDRYGHIRRTLKPWNKETITTDYTASVLPHIPQYDDFIIEPSNTSYREHIDGFYNMYAAFSHKPFDGVVADTDIPHSLQLIKHLFGEQFYLGLQYMKLLYEKPKQHLPVLCIVSKERETGKTTFINWINMIFGDNYIPIRPEDIGDKFNEIYANKNIISIEEAIIHDANMIEKIKTLATGKTIIINQKFISKCILPFFAKLIICTNLENEFMKIDSEEIRFWVIKAAHIQHKNTQMEECLSEEIPKFLTYLATQVKFPYMGASRMVFTSEQLRTSYLDNVVSESKSSLYKELRYYISEFFDTNESHDSFRATATDIKKEFFSDIATITPSQITRCLKAEFRMETIETPARYKPFEKEMTLVQGRYYEFNRSEFVTD